MQHEQDRTETIQYLQMIQNTMSRMATSSALFKGFSATIVAGISMISYYQQNTFVIVLSFMPVAIFALLDIYYLQLERKLRYLYNLVREGKHPCDFSMDLKDDDIEDAGEARIRIRDCIVSKSILIFYPAMIIILLLVIYMRVKGVV